MVKTRIFLVDDHEALLHELRHALKSEFRIVGVAGSGEALLLEAPKVSPQVIVLDVSLPGMSGIQAAEQLKSIMPEVKIVMLSMHADSAYAIAALDAGASAYVVKSSGVSELAKAIREVQAGFEYVPPSSSKTS
jgi:DNA-binding NarL/FixJ family response regulator